MSLTGTQEIDYIQAAQYRVAADTRLLKKTVTLTVSAGSSVIGLPAELIRLEALYGADGTLITPIPVQDYMKLATGNTTVLLQNSVQMVFCAVGRTLNIYPAPATALTLTAFYCYRPAPIDSSSTLELSGTAERLVERVASAYLLLDDGQPELAQSELADYAKAAGRLRTQDRGVEGSGGFLSVAGRRKPLL